MMGLAGVDPMNSAVKNWRLEKTHGSCLAAGVEGSIPGFGANLLVIDDYMKDAKSAYSQRVRDGQWDWFRSTSSTRLEPGGKIVLLCCLAGDSMISMADGTTKKIKDLSPGESVKSFDSGQCVSSNIVNHANVGRDNVFRVRLESGKSIVGNARHPFLVEWNGELKWVRLKNLSASMKIVTYQKNLPALSKDAIENGTRCKNAGITITKQGEKEPQSSRTTMANGKVRLASGKDAISQLNAKGTAQTTICATGLPTRINLRAATLRTLEKLTCGIGTGSGSKNTIECLQSKEAAAQFARKSEPQRIATEGKTSASITATKLERSEVCYVHSAISPQDTLEPVPPPLDSLNTSEFTSERIVSIEQAGSEDVYDIEVENTGSFIANGMVTHNTQWHEDDLIGRIEKQKEELELRVRSITLQALREGTEKKDPLGRAEGEALWPERWPAEVMQRRKRQSGHWWDSIYQGNPKGSSMSNWPDSYFQNIWAQDDEFPDPRSCYLSASFLDPSKGRADKNGDYQAITWIGYHNGLFYVDSHIDRMPVPKMLKTFVEWNRERRTAFVGIEGNAWQDLLAEPYYELCAEMGYNADPPDLIINTVNKNVRIERLGKWFHDRRFRFRKTASNELLINQCKEFPYGDKKDGPDSLESCLTKLCRSVDALHGMHEVTETEI
jgi:phage terminase large subunit-like protein